MSDFTVDSLKDHFDSLRVADQTAIQAALASQEKAVIKAENAAEERFKLLNELRQGVATKEQLEAIEKVVQSLTDRLNRSEGMTNGSDISIGKIYAGLGAVGAILAIVVMLSNGVF